LIFLFLFLSRKKEKRLISSGLGEVKSSLKRKTITSTPRKPKAYSRWMGLRKWPSRKFGTGPLKSRALFEPARTLIQMHLTASLPGFRPRRKFLGHFLQPLIFFFLFLSRKKEKTLINSDLDEVKSSLKRKTITSAPRKPKAHSRWTGLRK
jgi:hypothetical protein